MARHITELNIGTYRGIKDLEIKDFGDINILVGDNNCGKTSVLETIRILAQPDDIGNLFQTITVRAMKTKRKDLIDTFVTGFSKEEIGDDEINSNMGDNYYLIISAYSHTKKIDLAISGFISKELNLETEKDDKINEIFDGSLKSNINGIKNIKPFTISSTKNLKVDESQEAYKAVFMPVNVKIYDSCVWLYPQVIKNDKKDLFLSILQLFDKDVIDFTVIDDMIWIHHIKKHPMPLFSYGTGMQKAMLIGIVLVMAENGVLLIDEFETAIHTSIMDEIFSFIIRSCKELNVQLFLTTHSIEAVDKMLQCDEGVLDDMRVITLYKNQDKTVARNLTGRKALEVKNELGLELR